MIYGVKRNDPPNGIRFDVRSDLGDARAFDLAGEIVIPYGVGTFSKAVVAGWNGRGTHRLDTFDARPAELRQLARQARTCE